MCCWKLPLLLFDNEFQPNYAFQWSPTRSNQSEMPVCRSDGYEAFTVCSGVVTLLSGKSFQDKQTRANPGQGWLGLHRTDVSSGRAALSVCPSALLAAVCQQPQAAFPQRPSARGIAVTQTFTAWSRASKQNNYCPHLVEGGIVARISLWLKNY